MLLIEGKSRIGSVAARNRIFSLSTEHNIKGQVMIEYGNDSIKWLNIHSIRLFLYFCSSVFIDWMKGRVLILDAWQILFGGLLEVASGLLCKKSFYKWFCYVRSQHQFRLKGARGILDKRPYLSFINAISIYYLYFLATTFPFDKGWKDRFKYLMLDRSNCRDSLKVGFVSISKDFSA